MSDKSNAIQDRDAPAYQEYAAAILAKVEFRTISLAARGLLMTMRLDCWVNRRIPSDPKKLAKYLGLTIDEVKENLPDVMPFFAIDGDYIICPELVAYRAKLEYEKERKAEGGRNSAKKTNEMRWGKRPEPGADDVSGISSSKRRDTRRESVESLVQISSVQHSKNQYSGTGIDEDWIRDYEKESNGG